MKKILAVALISVVTLVISSGCKDNAPKVSNISEALKVRDAKISEEALYVGKYDNKKIIHAVEKAGEKTGWTITKFKGNEVLAEKTDGEDTVSSSVTFSEGYVEFSNDADTSDLRNAIKEEVSSNTSSH